jgi:hypothetical protein
MSDMAYRSFGLGKTKSSPMWQIIKYGRTSWCKREVVGEIRPNVHYDDFGSLFRQKELCHTCYGALDSADLPETMRHMPPGLARMERLR